MHETLKAMKRRQRDPNFTSRYFVGHGIDIGSGPDPLGHQKLYDAWPMMQACDEWDIEDGDAQVMEGVPDATYDFVYSSHTLEHVVEPFATLLRWWQILKPGGHLVVVVPDEDMYERGVWPPHFNTDHKHTFALAKATSWSPVSRNLDDLLRSLGGEVIKIERIEENFVFGAPPEVDQTSMSIAECCIEAVVRKPRVHVRAE